MRGRCAQEKTWRASCTLRLCPGKLSSLQNSVDNQDEDEGTGSVVHFTVSLERTGGITHRCCEATHRATSSESIINKYSVSLKDEHGPGQAVALKALLGISCTTLMPGKRWVKVWLFFSSDDTLGLYGRSIGYYFGALDSGA